MCVRILVAGVRAFDLFVLLFLFMIQLGFKLLIIFEAAKGKNGRLLMFVSVCVHVFVCLAVISKRGLFIVSLVVTVIAYNYNILSSRCSSS